MPLPHHYFTRLHTALTGGMVRPAGQGEWFVSDIFSEVDEEVRRERLQKLWERYGVYLIAACVLLVAVVGGWRGYEWYEAKKAAEAGASFEAAIALADQGKIGRASCRERV